MDEVAFITVESEDDLIVSFVVTDGVGDVGSVMLMRSPKYEGPLDEAERGVSFSDDRSDVDVEAMIRRVRIDADTVTLETELGECTLDLSGVDALELEEARRVLTQMNFDGRFDLSIS